MSFLRRVLPTFGRAQARMMGSYKNITSDAEFTQFMDAHAKQDKLVVVDWFATWCGPCVRIAPFFEKMSTEHPDVAFAKVDVDQCEDSAAQAGVEAMPTFQFYRQGKKVQQMAGADPNKLTSLVTSLKKK